jgi:TM2 domain-containing membrane protein YozV
MADMAIAIPKNLRENCVIAGALSALVCGLGQVYSGRKGRGIMLFLIFGILVALTTTVWIFGIVDAVTGTGRTKRA